MRPRLFYNMTFHLIFQEHVLSSFSLNHRHDTDPELGACLFHKLRRELGEYWADGGDQPGFVVVRGHVGDVLDVWPNEVVQLVQVGGGGGSGRMVQIRSPPSEVKAGSLWTWIGRGHELYSGASPISLVEHCVTFRHDRRLLSLLGFVHNWPTSRWSTTKKENQLSLNGNGKWS